MRNIGRFNIVIDTSKCISNIEIQVRGEYFIHIKNEYYIYQYSDKYNK
jgi:hypothetical protein